jgi:hypothetical protein
MAGLPKILRSFLADRGGNIAITTAFVLPLVIGCFGLGAETAAWMTSKRTMQNAADAAAIAAATNAGPSYGAEARAVTAQYGFKDGQDHVTVAVSDTAACPDGTADCYSVTVSRTMPLMLAQITGYAGDAILDGRPAKLISATAVATQGAQPREYCVLTLDNSGVSPALRTNGAPKANLSGCDLMSNGDADCNGHNLGADHGDAHGENDGCGVDQSSNRPRIPDPYAKLADNIPADTCDSYPQKPAKKKDPALPPSNKVQDTPDWSSAQPICGDLQLTGDVTLTKDTTLYIYNGQLDTNGYTFRTAPGVSATIVFTGDNGADYTHAPTGGGTLDITAPKTGPWAGMAIYQDPALSQGVNISAAGNSPTWDLTGVVYLPHASVTFSGAVNKSSNGKSCFGLVVDNLLINGTGSILAHGECKDAGVTLPTGQVPSRGKLVL